MTSDWIVDSYGTGNGGGVRECDTGLIVRHRDRERESRVIKSSFQECVQVSRKETNKIRWKHWMRLTGCVS